MVANVVRDIVPLMVACAMVGVGGAGLMGWTSAGPVVGVGGMVAVVLLSVSLYQSYRAVSAS